MEYQKIINLLENTPNQLRKFRTKNWVEVNDESRGTYNVNSQIKFTTSILRSCLCDWVVLVKKPQARYGKKIFYNFQSCHN